MRLPRDTLTSEGGSTVFAVRLIACVVAALGVAACAQGQSGPSAALCGHLLDLDGSIDVLVANPGPEAFDVVTDDYRRLAQASNAEDFESDAVNKARTAWASYLMMIDGEPPQTQGSPTNVAIQLREHREDVAAAWDAIFEPLEPLERECRSERSD